MKFKKPESLDSLAISLGIGGAMAIVTQLSNDGVNNTTNFVGGMIGAGSIPLAVKYLNVIKTSSMEKLPYPLVIGSSEAVYLVTYSLINLF